MKKNLLLMMAVPLALASCSNEDVLETNPKTVPDDAITFRANVGYTSQSRGTETTQSNLKAFYVTAIEKNNNAALFTNLLFNKNTSGEFVSDPVYQWSNKLGLTFYAYGYTPKGNNSTMVNPNIQDGWEEGTEANVQLRQTLGEPQITEMQQTLDNFTPNQDIAEQVDLVTAMTESNRTALNASVGLNFIHILSEVDVRAKCTSNAHHIYIKAVKLGKIDTKAQYSWPTTSSTPWNLGGSYKTSYTVWQNENHQAVDLTTTREGGYIPLISGKAGYAMLIPQGLSTWGQTTETFETQYPDKSVTEAQYIALLIKIVGIDNGEINNSVVKFPLKTEHAVDEDGFGWAYIPLHVDKVPKWDMGTRYIYHLDMSRGAGYNEEGEPILTADIQFTADVKEWSSVNIYKPGDKVEEEK